MEFMVNNTWHEWICHTNFSFLIGASHPDELVNRAIHENYRSLSITDYDGLYGIVRAYRAVKKFNEDHEDKPTSLRLHYGSEIHLQKDHHIPIYWQDTLVLLARSKAAYVRLCELLSYAHREGKKDPFVPLGYLLTHSVKDFVAIMPMRGLIRSFEENAEAKIKERCFQLKSVFKENLYLALSIHLHPFEDHWIKRVLKLSQEMNIPILFSQDTYFDKPEKKVLSDVLHAMRLNRKVEDCQEHLFANAQRYLWSLQKLKKAYADVPGYQQIIRNSHELAASFDFELTELKYHYPKEMIPKGHDALSYLKHLVESRCKGLYHLGVPQKVQEALNHELELVEELEFADYFLTVWDILNGRENRKSFAREEEVPRTARSVTYSESLL